jgi:hypothetical protein
MVRHDASAEKAELNECQRMSLWNTTLAALQQRPIQLFRVGRIVALRGESPRASHERRERLDYERLLAEAKRARGEAADRLEALERLQDQQEQNRARRGKW